MYSVASKRLPRLEIFSKLLGALSNFGTENNNLEVYAPGWKFRSFVCMTLFLVSLIKRYLNVRARKDERKCQEFYIHLKKVRCIFPGFFYTFSE